MGTLVGSFIFPHPPILLPEIGAGQEKEAKKTSEAMDECSKMIRDLAPDTVILISPHGPIFSDYVFMSENRILSGDFQMFGHPELTAHFQNNQALALSIAQEALSRDFFCGDLTEEQYTQFHVKKGLDHGALVPLYFVKKQYTEFSLVHLSVASFTPTELYAFGKVIQTAILKSEGNIVLIASGDLSHKFSDKSPYGFHPSGPKFDDILMSALEAGDFLQVLTMEETLCHEAAECGMKSFYMMLGANDGLSLDIKLHSHEGPFGIGYGVLSFIPSGMDSSRDFLRQVTEHHVAVAAEKKKHQDPYVALARLSLEHYLLHRSKLKLSEAMKNIDLPGELLSNQAGAFVSIKKAGQLRGCIGTISPTKETLGEEILENAISAGTRDPRFPPILYREFEDLVFSVDVLSEAESIPDASYLDVKKYGVIVTSGLRRGLLLPNLETVDTIDQQISIALSKAGIGPEEAYSLERFEVIRHY